MNTPDLVKEISERTGIPIAKVRGVVFDFSRDIQSIVSYKSTGAFNIPHLGYFYTNPEIILRHMFYLVKYLEGSVSRRPELLEIYRYRKIFTSHVDDFYACATLVSEHVKIRNEEYRRGAGKRWWFDVDIYQGLLLRMGRFIDKLPTTLVRKKHSEIQKICLRRLQEQGVLHAPPGDKDCQMHPMRMCAQS